MLVPGDPRHGTANGYHNQGCRCVDCTEAWRVYQKKTIQKHPEYLERSQTRRREREGITKPALVLCPRCDRTFLSERGLKLHISAVHFSSDATSGQKSSSSTS